MQAVVMVFLMGGAISSSVTSLFGAGGAREAMPVRLVMSGKTSKIIPKGGGGIGGTQSSSEAVDSGKLGSQRTMGTVSRVSMEETRGYVWAPFAVPLADRNLVW